MNGWNEEAPVMDRGFFYSVGDDQRWITNRSV
jgi:hypothetical protein